MEVLINDFTSPTWPWLVVRKTWISVLGCNAGRGGEDVLEPVAFG